MKDRNLQIELAGNEFIKKNHSELQDDDFALGYGFQEGAKWADANQSLDKTIEESIKIKKLASNYYNQAVTQQMLYQKTKEKLQIAMDALNHYAQISNEGKPDDDSIYALTALTRIEAIKND